MSKFLAPIHFKQYDKIINQETMVLTILDLNDREKWIDNLRYGVNTHVGVIENQALEHIIDEGNIHGWLSQKIDIVEKRLSYVVDNILIEDRNRLDTIIEEIGKLGREKNMHSNNLIDIYNIIDESFLNGMPCDGIIQVLERDDNTLSWIMNRDIHSCYWDSPEDKIYFKLKTSFIKGLIENKNISYLEEDNTHRLEMK